jgi:DNA repair protein RadA/Sms
MIIAVLEAHCGVRLGQHDVYLNMWRAATASPNPRPIWPWRRSGLLLAGLALPSDCVYFGEVSLSGAIRPVAQTGLRLKEAQKLGFANAVLPSGSADLPSKSGAGLAQMETLADLVARIAGSKGALLAGVTGTKTECSLSGRRMARVGKA